MIDLADPAVVLQDNLRHLTEFKRAAMMARLAWIDRARPKQIPPPGDWFVFLAMAGRGFGKTLLGAHEAFWHAASNDEHRVAVVAPSQNDLRRVCFGGDSGLLRIIPKECLYGGTIKTAYNKTHQELLLANGSIIQGFPATEPERLRGPQFHFAWCDEIGTWRGMDAWEMLMFGLRLGADPRVIATTTPRPVAIVRELVHGSQYDVKIVRGSTYENGDNLSPRFIHQIEKKFAGTRLGRQELNAELLEDIPGALWQGSQIEATRIKVDGTRKFRCLADIQHLGINFARIVVAIDPAVTSGEKADSTGIIVAGVYEFEGRDNAIILEDLTCKGSPQEWAKIAHDAYVRWAADRIVGEVNNGGDLIESTIRMVDPNASYRKVYASKGKVIRAEPVSALYEQGRVHHLGVFPDLEDQMCNFTTDFDKKVMGFSPDRVDALVWAVTDLIVDSSLAPYSENIGYTGR